MEIVQVHHKKGRVKKETLIEVSGIAFDPLFQGLIKSLGDSCKQFLLGDPSEQSRLLEGHDLLGDPRCAEFPDMDPGFVIDVPPGPDLDPGFVLHVPPGPSLDPCFDPCSPECLDR